MTTIVALINREMYRAVVISQRVQNDFVMGLQVAKLNELMARCYCPGWCLRREFTHAKTQKKDE